MGRSGVLIELRLWVRIRPLLIQRGRLCVLCRGPLAKPKGYARRPQQDEHWVFTNEMQPFIYGRDKIFRCDFTTLFVPKYRLFVLVQRTSFINILVTHFELPICKSCLISSSASCEVTILPPDW